MKKCLDEYCLTGVPLPQVPQEKTFRELKTEGGIKSFHQHNEFSDIPKMLSLMF
jgi:hypothetical protein